ncbi:Kinesin motor domain [Carpediemonas membranifera]|uniref:Kinesin-like protein n=1 Tax=Carpediemonas membranifera TaxID=201153 RepID=A0A8J6E2L6_9EUKA|nr:Kinesin motor domain [Carpediemonas membranifera]|eukprot:KAG9392047.1 Kinesin motor domain [Carpediemonas membranifera]
MSASNVAIAVRIRPESKIEREKKHPIIISRVSEDMLFFDPEPSSYHGANNVVAMVHGKQCPVNRRYKNLSFQFDSVLENATNKQVYQATAQKMLGPVFDGINATVFAYGATGAGKTFTMMGEPSQNIEGVMMLTMEEVFARIAASADTKRIKVVVSYIEIYNEQIHDLLAPPVKGKARVLDLREDPAKGMTIAGLSEETPEKLADVISIIARGTANRTQFSTAANQQSSRSHAVFQVRIEQCDRTAAITEPMLVSKLSLIDLAGSERACRTQNKGIRLIEGANINRSLLTLGSCINALCKPPTNGRRQYVPYRNSKLTRLLKDSLGGSCRTCMIANISPSGYNYQDTLNTLNYANRAKEIKTTATRNVVTVKHSAVEHQRIIKDLQLENMQLKNTIAELKAEVERLRAAPPVPLETKRVCMDETEVEEDADVSMFSHTSELKEDTPARGPMPAMRRPAGEQARPATVGGMMPSMSRNETPAMVVRASVGSVRPSTSVAMAPPTGSVAPKSAAGRGMRGDQEKLDARKRKLAEYLDRKKQAKKQAQNGGQPPRSARAAPMGENARPMSARTKNVRFTDNVKENATNRPAPVVSLNLKFDELTKIHSGLKPTRRVVPRRSGFQNA